MPAFSFPSFSTQAEFFEISFHNRIAHFKTFHILNFFFVANVIEIRKLNSQKLRVKRSPENFAGLFDYFIEGMEFFHYEIEVNIIFPLRPSAKRKSFHRRERQKIRHGYHALKLFRMGNFVWKIEKSKFDIMKKNRQLSRAVNQHLFFFDKPGKHFPYPEILEFFFGKKIKINRSPMADVERNSCPANHIEFALEFFHERQKLDLLFGQNLFMHIF